MPAKFRVRITRTAERDLEEAWAFIAQDSPEEAERFVGRLEEQIESLGTRYRHLVYGNYRTEFRIPGKVVYVLRVIHGARLLDTLMFSD